MSTNLRKAQKHMQRATELLNQSQLGFGVPDSTNGDAPNRNENKRLQNEINSGKHMQKKTKTDPMIMDLSMVPDKTQKEHIKLPCKHACMMWRAAQGPPRHGYTFVYPESFAHVCPEAFFGPQIKISLRIIVGHNPGLPSRPSAFEESARVQVAPVRENLRRMPGFHEARERRIFLSGSR